MFSQSHIIKLTVVLYKVSDLFPEKEPLKVLIRKKADEVLAGLILNDKDINKDIEVMKAYIELSSNFTWVKKEYLEVLKREYSLIGEGLRKPAFVPPVVGTTAGEGSRREVNLNPRHKKIVEILKKGKLIQVKDLKNIFPDISKRTLRRDFEYLLEKGLVDRVGDNNNTEYMLKKKILLR